MNRSTDPAEGARAAALDNFSTLFEFLPIGAFRAGPDGLLMRVNPALARMNGCSTEAEALQLANAAGAAWYVQPGRRSEFRRLLERDGEVRHFVSEVVPHRGGQRMWVSENAHRVCDTAGRVLYYEGTVEDVTERLNAEAALARSEQLFRLIADELPGMVYRLEIAPGGRGRRYTFVSQGARALFGVEPSAIMADPALLRSFEHPDDKPLIEASIAATARTGGSRSTEYRYIRPDGEVRWAQIFSNGLSGADGSAVRTGVVIDITERKQAELLVAERERAEMTRRAQAQLLSRVSHELRTPLNAVLGFAQLIAMDAGLSPKLQEWAQHILDSGQHLLGLVEDVLDLASAQSGRPNLGCRPVELLPVLAESWTMVAAATSARETVDYRPPPPDTPPLRVLADPRRLKQIAANLMSNAVKYNRAGGFVEVQARAVDGVVEFTVRDSGRGMDRQQLARLFNPFERLGAETSRIEGRGLGLALARQLAEAMGGSIEAASEVGTGSCFTVRLPAAE